MHLLGFGFMESEGGWAKYFERAENIECNRDNFYNQEAAAVIDKARAVVSQRTRGHRVCPSLC